MDEKRRRRWFLFILGTLLALIAAAAAAVWIGKSREPKWVSIVVADDTALTQSDLVLIGARLAFQERQGVAAEPDPTTFRGKTVFSVRGADQAHVIEYLLSLSLSNPGVSPTGLPEADVVFNRHHVNLKADDYELLRYDAQGHTTRLPTRDVGVIVVKNRSPGLPAGNTKPIGPASP